MTESPAVYWCMEAYSFSSYMYLYICKVSSYLFTSVGSGTIFFGTHLVFNMSKIKRPLFTALIFCSKDIQTVMRLSSLHIHRWVKITILVLNQKHLVREVCLQ